MGKLLAICTGTCTVQGVPSELVIHTDTISVTAAAAKGLSKLVREAEAGHDVVVCKRNVPTAVVVGYERYAELSETEADLRDLALVVTRMATDNGNRTSVDDAIAMLGFDRAELDAQLDAEFAAETA